MQQLQKHISKEIYAIIIESQKSRRGTFYNFNGSAIRAIPPADTCLYASQS